MEHNEHIFRSNYVAPWESKEIRVAVVLGGGGVKGASHAGLLEVLEKNKIPIDLMIGSSVGSFIAACYAYYQSWEILLDKYKTGKVDDIVDMSFFNVLRMLYSKTGLCQGNRFQKLIEHQLPNEDILALSIPTIIMATDLTTFKACEIKTGNVIKAVEASTAVPPFYSPVEFGGKIMIDGAICSPLPTDIARKYGAKIVIASDLSCNKGDIDTSNMAKIFYQSLNQSYYHLTKFQRKYADICINPTLNFATLEDVDFNVVYTAGKREALNAMPTINKLLDNL